MQSFTEDQLEYRTVAQLAEALKEKLDEKVIFDRLNQIKDVNLKVLSNSSREGIFVGSTLLHIACFYKHIQVFDTLLERGADFTAKNRSGDTVLHRTFCVNFFGIDENRITASNVIKDSFIDSVLTAHVTSGNSANSYSASGLSHFHVACAANHLKAVQFFTDAGVSVNESVNENAYEFPGYTPLHFTARFVGFEAMKILLKHGAHVCAKDTKGCTPMHIVVERNLKLFELRNKADDQYLDNIKKCIEENEKIIELLLHHNTEMEFNNKGFRKIHAACSLNNSSLAERFLQDMNIDCPIDMDSLIWPGFTTLHFSVKSNNTKILKLLLEKGAVIEAEDAAGITPFDLCKKQYNIEELNDILSAIPLFKNICFSDNQTKLMDFMHALCSPSMLDEFFRIAPQNLFLPLNSPLWPGYSLSHMAILFSEVIGIEAVKMFINFSDKVMKQDSRRRTPLHFSFYKGKFDIVKIFFEKQHGLTDVLDNNSLSYLHIACDINNKNVVQTLLSNGADVNVTYKGRISDRLINIGSTPLHIAVSRKNIEIIKILNRCGANVNKTDGVGLTPIHLLFYVTAERNCYVDPQIMNKISDLLLSSPGLINAVFDRNGLSHLHVATFMGNEHTVERLLNLGADPNAVIFRINPVSSIGDINVYIGYTPLHFAVERKKSKLIKMLLQGGADILYKKPNGMALLYDVLFQKTFYKASSIDISIKRTFTTMLENDVALKKRVQDDSGLTLLHIACYLYDTKQIQNLLLDPRVDVNAQLQARLPVWSQASPLHLLIDSANHVKDMEHTVELLLKRGADVTLANKYGDTPVHKAWSQHGADKLLGPNYDCMDLLLRYHKDFSINPVSRGGISHFHLACLIGEYTIVEKFLISGVDVNLPIDCYDGSLTFQTPMRFLLESIIVSERLLPTIDVLLKYGADVNTTDEKGVSPFLQAASRLSDRNIYFEKLKKSGANIYSTSMKGETALDIFVFDISTIEKDDLLFFLDKSNFFNTYNSINGTGFIARILFRKKRFNHNQKITLDIMMENPNVFIVDQRKRTPIHNMVANHITAIPSDAYLNYIEKFIKMGFDIDAQDSEGNTALHFAAHFCNVEATLGLLFAGADINITNNINRTAYKVICGIESNLALKTRKILLKSQIVFHTIAKLLCGLEVHPSELKAIEPMRSQERFRNFCEDVTKELAMTQLIKIGTGSLTLRDFISETGAVASRPYMICQADLKAIDNFFESIDTKLFRKIRTLIKLQFRKMLIRLRLIEPATESLKNLVGNVNGFSMPDMCCRIILRFLTNTEIKNLINSTSVN